MVLSTVYIVRHGYRSNWLPLDQQVPPPTGVDSDPPLAPHGVAQSKELCTYLTSGVAKEGLPVPQMAFSSPFYRCVETIMPTADALDLQIHIDRGLGEWFKPNRATIPIPATSEAMHKFFERVPSPAVWDWGTVIPSIAGETEEAIFNRCKTFWAEFIPKFEAQFPHVDSIVIVTHAATKISLGMSLLGYQSNRDYLEKKDMGDGKTTQIGGSTCSVDGYQRKGDEWRLVKNSETGFLTNGAEMEWHYSSSQFEAGSKEDVEYRRKLQEEQDRVNQRNPRHCRL